MQGAFSSTFCVAGFSVLANACIQKVYPTLHLLDQAISRCEPVANHTCNLVMLASNPGSSGSSLGWSVSSPDWLVSSQGSLVSNLG